MEIPSGLEIEAISDEIVRNLMCEWKVPLSKSDNSYLIPGCASAIVYDLLILWLKMLEKDE